MGRAAKSFYLAVFTLLGHSHHASAVAQPGQATCAIDPQALVSDACASFSTLDDLNRELQPSLRSLTKESDFFSYYRLNLYNKVCPFWSDDNDMCGNIACAVNTIDNEEEVPAIWRTEELSKLEGPKAGHPNRKMQNERQAKPLLGELGADVGESCVVEYDDECDDRDYCVPEDEGASSKGDYVSLVENPERYTGYSGPGARHVWEAMYRENCFSKQETAQTQLSPASPFGISGFQGEAAQDLKSALHERDRQHFLSSGAPAPSLEDGLELDDECLEKRVFYRVISGMHASISTHLCHDYLNKTTGEWGPNLQCYQERLQKHPERISNLYFDYALVLRALEKARPALESYTFCSGDPVQDALTKHKVLGLADLVARGPHIYDERLMFQDATDPNLKEEFKLRFRNVSRTMDCVGCDKCRLWGKLQTAGYGTALKILFEFDEKDNSKNPPLRRTELVALINTLDKISHALSAVDAFEKMLIEDDGYDEKKEQKEPTFADELREAFSDEWEQFMFALKHVLRKYYEFPSTVYNIVLTELLRGYEYWIGLPVHPRSWYFDWTAKSKDEL